MGCNDLASFLEERNRRAGHFGSSPLIIGWWGLLGGGGGGGFGRDFFLGGVGFLLWGGIFLGEGNFLTGVKEKEMKKSI